ncbi:MAG TPA: formate dehydrogenase accessory protein FdhE [Firmicutes bacterium]|nr:formate dehydrogenase accessory protein FdhE [Bacillota bacterium]
MSNGLAGLWPEIDKELTALGPDRLEPAVKLYRDIFSIWCCFQDRINYHGLSCPPEQVKPALRQGKHLLGSRPLALERSLFREVLCKVAEKATEYYPQARNFFNRLRLESGDSPELAMLFDQAAFLDRRRLQQYLWEQPWIGEAGLDPALIGHLIFIAAVPFYTKYAAMAVEQIDFSIWSEGYCPVCGQQPMMAKLRAEDGARVLECGLCHAQWQFPRLECPFCRNRGFQQQQYFYTDEIPGRRMYLCECCKGYLKTTVVKEIGHKVILEIENMFTLQLDSLARKEGYRPGEELVLLNLNRQGG